MEIALWILAYACFSLTAITITDVMSTVFVIHINNIKKKGEKHKRNK